MVASRLADLDELLPYPAIARSVSASERCDHENRISVLRVVDRGARESNRGALGVETHLGFDEHAGTQCAPGICEARLHADAQSRRGDERIDRRDASVDSGARCPWLGERDADWQTRPQVAGP